MPTEYPEDDSRTAPFQAPQGESAPRRATEPKTRYVDVPQSPERAAGPRNLAWGVIFLVGALCAFWFASILSSRNAARSLVACLGTFGLVWLFYNLRVLRQRNGIFLALSAILLFGAALPLVEVGFTSLDRLARERLGEEEKVAKLDVVPPPPTLKTAPPAPEAPELAPETVLSEKPVPPEPVDDVLRELMVPPPPPTAKKVIEITEDVETKINGRRFLVKQGDTFEFISIKDGMTTFKAGTDTVSVSSDVARFKLSFDELFALANKEAMRLYPGLAEKFSDQNQKFVEASRELKETLPDFFKSPEWPLKLARDLAAANGWKSVDELADEAKAPKSEAPAEPAAPEPVQPPAPPKAPDVPQENPLPPLPPEGQ
jgi:hypothetical protein